ncbi:palmitoleoyl-protein carboxylesterase NOTUM isoform X2 [Glossina fuscipes]|uniref:Palmitoleoyl-protein carboxylesterase NOTUM isoform X2 n=1 Tax=Glossina fuscipes TaxID=7396 RepID=A0A8U0W7C4_9MUSC|nr:palmitoleoyl-protein carboxylesterase NOTUM isoform X2 [Glossina fuscipes]
MISKCNSLEMIHFRILTNSYSGMRRNCQKWIIDQWPQICYTSGDTDTSRIHSCEMLSTFPACIDRSILDNDNAASLCQCIQQCTAARSHATLKYVFYNVFLTFVFCLLLCNSRLVMAYPASIQISSTSTPVVSLLGKPVTAKNSLNATTSLLLSMHQRFSMENNSIQKQPSSVPSSTVQERSRALKRVFLSNRTIVCNDGTLAGFYLRKNANSRKWIVFLEGGWHCYDMKTCRSRWTRLRHLMTSSQWPETRDVGGILSPLPEENSYWHSANHVLVPYCSSDSWSGTKAEPDSPELNFRFMGALILRQVVSDLIPLGLGRAKGAELLLVGSSAGGLGVMLNLDRITHYLQHERQLQVTVRGVSDSGWFLDREPYTPSAVASSEAVRQGWSMWQGSLPESCAQLHKSEPWRCYFGYRLYPTLKAPLFVFQWLFDEAQMRADNVASPVTPHQWNYIHAMGGALRSSLDNVSAVFAPSCIGHAVLSKREWLTIKIDEISLPTALRCWEHATRPHRKSYGKLKRSTEATTYENHKRHDKQKSRKQNAEKRRLDKSERENNNHLRHKQQKRHEERRKRRKNNMAFIHENNLTNGISSSDNNSTNAQNRKNKNRRRNDFEKQRGERHIQQKKRRRRRKEQQKQQRLSSLRTDFSTDSIHLEKRRNLLSKINKRTGVPRVPEKCSLRLMERCSWPQCNHSCPSLTNPATGEEMRFLELLSSFGLDIEAVATALGVDMQTLNNMDRTELVNLLTQQVS